MTKKIDYFEDFLKTVEAKKVDIEKAKSKKQRFYIPLLAVYLAVLSIGFTQIDDLELFSSSTGTSKNISKLESRIEEIETDIKSLNTAFTESTNPSYVYLNTQLQDIKEKNSYLYQTILENPDTAITPKILSREQENINEKIEELKSRVDRTNTILWLIFIALVVAILGFIGKQIWNVYFSKSNVYLG